MANARFQVVSLPRRPSDPSRRFVWRFLAANNRTLAQATAVYLDAESCIAAMNTLRRGLTTAECEFVRDADGLWKWTVRLHSDVVASTHRYPRQVRARLTCDTFLELAAAPDMLTNVQVVYR